MTPMETVYESGAEKIRRIAVEGGWLYEWAIVDKFVNVTFVPYAAQGADAPRHICDHGFAATSCGFCNHGSVFGSGR